MTRQTQTADYVTQAIETLAATKIQNTARMFQAKRKYSIAPCKTTMTDTVFCTGNDPKGLTIAPHLKSTEPFALIATSCLRSLDIAAGFCADHTDYVPKIYIVDINKNVRIFWLMIKTIFNCSHTFDELFQNITANQQDLLPLIGNDTIDLFDMLMQLKDVATKISFNRLKKIVQNLVPLTHDWTDKEAIKNIKAICDAIGLKKIYVYASNILSCIDEKNFDKEPEIKQMLENIQALMPVASVYSDIDLEKRKPGEIMCLDGAGDLAFLQKMLSIKACMREFIIKQSQHFATGFKAHDFENASNYALSAYLKYKEIADLTLETDKVELSDLAHNLGAVLHELSKKDSLYTCKAAEILAEAHELRVATNHPRTATTEKRLLEILATQNHTPTCR